MNSIPAKRLVDILPSVLGAGGNPLSLNSIFLTTDDSIPVGTVQGFPSADAVGNWFGFSSIEYILAAIYFAGYENAQTLPSVIYFAQFNTIAVEAYLRSASFVGTSLAQLQALSGVLNLVIDGVPVTSANINLAGAASFTNAAALIQTGVQTPGGIFSGQAKIDDGAGGVGNTLTVSVVTTGAIHIGSVIVGAGIAGGTTVTAFVSGTGGVGTYTVNGAAQLVTPAEAVTVSSTATVTYDSQRAAFIIHSPTTGVASTMGYAAGSLSAGLKLTAVTAAVLSQGAAIAVPAAAMSAIANVTQNWATFMTVFEPITATKIAFAQWVQTTQKRFAYVAWDSSVTITTGTDPTSFGALCKAGAYDGIYPRYEPATDAGNGRKAAFICGTAASVDFLANQGRITFAYKGQAGLVADVTDSTVADNLEANGYNYYAAYATANDRFVNEQTGYTPGAYKFFDPYINQIWLNAALQLAFMELLTSIRSLPYNTAGYNLCRAAALDPINQAVFNGVIQPGVTLSSQQKAEINSAAGLSIADIIQTSGWYLQILDADPTTRSTRSSPPMTLWYTDGGSIQKIQLASIDVE